MADRISFGLWLQAEREKRGWSQSEFARKSGKDRAVISKIESGGALPAIETFISMANALGLPLVLLLRKAGLLPSEPNSDPWLEKMYLRLQKLSGPRRDLAEHLLNGLEAAETAAAEEEAARNQPAPKLRSAEK